MDVADARLHARPRHPRDLAGDGAASWPAWAPSPHSVRVVRAAKRFADALRAEWIVAYVETPGPCTALADADRTRVAETLRLAEQLGAETVVLTGRGVSEEILALRAAPQRQQDRRRQARATVAGEHLLVGSIADELVRGSGEIGRRT
ncbi:MAG: hypothetical protein MZV70_70215 [Desulfobacterales bacterium]|nr:hypothetical protein [Desulfobacterales bacterium]